MSGRFLVPLDLGDSVSDTSLSYLRRGVGKPHHGKRVAVYIGGAEKKILLDTGIPPDIERNQKYHPYSWTEPLKPGQGLVPQLAKIGVKPEDIDIVVLSHLHWDHVGGVTMFPNAQFIVSHDELRFAIDPTPCLYVPYEALLAGFEPMYLQVMKRMVTVDMREQKLVEGVKIIPLPGHTPGSIGLLVDTDNGPYTVVADAAGQLGNLEGFPEEGQPHWMDGIYTDMIAMWNTFEYIAELVGRDYSRVLVGHDVRNFRQERYP